MTHVLKAGLGKYGFNVETFNNANTALENFKPYHYDIILLDFKMPIMNGFELYKKIKELDPKISVCFLSADSSHYEEFTKLMPELDESQFMHKPLSLATLAKRLEKIIIENKTTHS
jgi:DNA-binding response OmpR family regulator